MSEDEGLAGIAVPAGEYYETIEHNRAGFAKAFGDDFAGCHVDGFWLGPSPDGQHVGMLFFLPDGRTVKAALPLNLLQSFGNELIFAATESAERADAAAIAADKGSGDA